MLYLCKDLYALIPDEVAVFWRLFGHNMKYGSIVVAPIQRRPSSSERLPYVGSF